MVVSVLQIVAPVFVIIAAGFAALRLGYLEASALAGLSAFVLRVALPALVFNALADAGRRRLLDALHGRDGQTLGELCVLLTMSRQAVSKHLGILERANLISTQKVGRRKLHYLNPVPIHMITRRWIRKYQPHQLDVLLDIKDKLENES